MIDTELHKKILEDHKELASLPQTLAEVIRVVKDDDASADEVANVIKHDPALTTKILRVVNSPIYSLAREVSTISQAVMTLGMRAVSSLALSTSIYDISGKFESTIDRRRYWRHSLEVAIACREIAEELRYNCAEEAFIAGLIHDIGVLILEKSFPEKFERIYKQAQAGENIFELEEQAWGSNHARIGRFLLEQWNLPESICLSVGYHASEFPPGNDDEDMKLPQIVALANMIANFTLTEVAPTIETDKEKKEIIACNLNLDPSSLARIEQSLVAKTLEEARFLEIDIGSEQDLLIEANRMLYNQFLTVEQLLEENRMLQDHIAKEKLKQAASETLNTITATFNHYINNAVATILGRAQLVEIALSRGDISDPKNVLPKSMRVITNGVATITAFMDELTKAADPKKIVYHDDTYILDLESRIKEQLALIEEEAAL